MLIQEYGKPMWSDPILHGRLFIIHCHLDILLHTINGLIVTYFLYTSFIFPYTHSPICFVNILMWEKI